MSAHTSFGDVIKARRTALGMSQVALADLVGRSASAIRSWERGSSTPTDESVVQSLSAVLGIEEAQLREAVGLPPAGPDTDTVDDTTLEAFVGGPASAGHELEAEEPIEDVDSIEHLELAEPAGFPDGEPEPVPAEVEEETAGDGTAVVPEPVPPADEEAPPRDESEAEEAGDELASHEPTREPVEPVPHEPASSRAVTSEDQATVIEPVAVAVADAPVAATRVDQHAVAPAPRSYLDDPDQMMTYWIRAALTVAFAVFLLIVLFWALGRLGDSIAEVWDLLKAGA